ncbi:class I SAM-dependent methyltransferase [Streptomyces sp. NBC_00648]|uniref:class I SAM-dependent methyltransferase n=1 Tax=Streptomyces sp. NBC_00648 TaxID=2975797 RepID=UPI0032530AF3
MPTTSSPSSTPPPADRDTQTGYWDAAAGQKVFTHPLYAPWLADVDRQTAVLDYGCGYGRTMADLTQRGFTNLTGADTSPGMIAEARTRHPALRFVTLDAPPTLPLPTENIDLALLFAVLTCVPDDAAQHALIAELARVLKPGGTLYISDYVLQSDPRNRARYDEYAATHGPSAPYGVFETTDGATCRHHPEPCSQLSSLLPSTPL